MTKDTKQTKGTRGVTIVIHADGDLESKQYRFPRWAVIAGKWGAGAIAVSVVLFFAFAGPITRNALRVPGLEREVSRLRVENSRVQQLASALNRAEANSRSCAKCSASKLLPSPAPPVGARSLATPISRRPCAPCQFGRCCRVLPLAMKPARRHHRIGPSMSKGLSLVARFGRAWSTNPTPVSISPSRLGRRCGHRGEAR